MRERCAQCLSQIPDHLAYETPHGEKLCGACYSALWGPRGRHMLAAITDKRPPVRPPRPEPAVSLLSPNGEPDNEHRIPRRGTSWWYEER